MSKCTPGPWEADYGGTVGHIKSVAPRDNGMTPTVARYNTGYCASSIPPDEQKANSRLIALAPEMLEFCKRVAYRYQVFCNGLVSPEMYADYREAIDLINKATGAQEANQ